MGKPQAVVFDLGKVLVDFDYGRTVRRIQSLCTTQGDALRQLIDQSPLLHRYEKGLISTQELFHAIQAEAGYTGTREQFSEAFADIFTPIEAMVELHAKLRQAGVPTFIFSNTNELAVTHIRERFPFFEKFDGYVLSYLHQAMKPEAKLYEVVEQTTGLTGAALLYIDDRHENVTAGAARGWQVVLHETPEQTINALRQVGIA
jgi:HAD superfamily hydrolase (TIGR01509 family)